MRKGISRRHCLTTLLSGLGACLLGRPQPAAANVPMPSPSPAALADERWPVLSFPYDATGCWTSFDGASLCYGANDASTDGRPR